MKYILRRLTSVSALRAVAPAWDDLWSRCDRSAPLARAELVAQWIEHFAPTAGFQALVVERAGAFLAALPLVSRRLRGPLAVGGMPSNNWSDGGELLLDPQCDVDAVLGTLVVGLRSTNWPLLWLDEVELAAPHWAAFVRALGRFGLRHDTKTMFTSGRVEVGADWDAFLAGRTKKHRHNMRRCLSRLHEAGPTEFKLYERVAEHEAPQLLRRGFEVEDRSWKGAQGTSVLKTPGMFEFLCRQATELARGGHLRVALLEHHGVPIAFDYGYAAAGICYRAKIGYDEQFSWCSPGQLLAMYGLERQFQQPEQRWTDFLGPLTDALEKWVTAPYLRQRLVIAQPTVVGRTLFEGYRAAQRLRQETADDATAAETTAAFTIIVPEMPTVFGGDVTSPC